MLAAFSRLTRSCRLRLRSLAILAVPLLILLQVAPAHASPALVVANWNDYINPDLIARFTEETGIVVDYRTFETDEDADALLRQEFPPDVLVPDSHYLPRLIQEGLLQPIAARSLAIYEDIDPLILSRLSSVDPGRRYAMPYMWGRVGIVMDRARVEQALGAEAPNSWGLLFDPRNLARLSSCGASLLDARAEFFALWMNWHGALAERPAGRELRAFHKALVDLRPHLRAVDNLAYLDDLPAGRQCIAMAWEGDARAMIGENPNLEFLIPDEGSTVYVDALVVPAKSRMPEQAWRFIEFMSRPEIAYLNAEHVQYNSPYKTVTRRLLLSKGDQPGWRSLRARGAGKAVSLVIGEGGRRPEVVEAWATFVGQREEGLAVGARE
jgi:putrescine transport system substrate-binding protein